MIVICEECGKKYEVDPSKIPGEKARFRCKACKHIIVVTKPKEPVLAPEEGVKVQEHIRPLEITPSEKREEIKREKKAESSETTDRRPKIELVEKKRRFGLRAKMILLFFVLPFLIILGTGAFYITQFGKLSSAITKEGVDITTRLGEEMIANIARSVASQVKLYLDAHPSLDKRNFDTDPVFKPIAVQKVGKTGYTALYELPDAEGIWRTWAHANPKIIGIDMSTLKGALGENFPGFWKIYTAVKAGKESKGYYAWKDPDGKIRDKFMVCTPVEGTKFIIAATTYISEFNQPMQELQTKAAEHIQTIRNLSLLILLLALAIFGVLVSLFGHRMTGKIKELTQAADRISVGDLDFEVKVKSNDEIGDLAEAISRMQDSIKLSIERLRRRKG